MMYWNDIIKMHELEKAADNTNCYCRPESNKMIDTFYANNSEYTFDFRRKNDMKKKEVRVTKVEVLNDRVVIMRFDDNTFTKAVCTEDDAKNGKFDIDIGITICIVKKLLGEAEGVKKAYSKLLRNIHKMMDAQKKEAEEEEKRKANAKARKARKAQRRAESEKQAIENYRNDITDAVLNALELLEKHKNENKKVD